MISNLRCDIMELKLKLRNGHFVLQYCLNKKTKVIAFFFTHSVAPKIHLDVLFFKCFTYFYNYVMLHLFPYLIDGKPTIPMPIIKLRKTSISFFIKGCFFNSRALAFG